MATIEEQLLYNLETFLDVFSTHDGSFRGYVDSKNRFEKFEENLRLIGMKFSTRRSRMGRDDSGSSGSPENSPVPEAEKKADQKSCEKDSKRLLFHQERGIPVTDIGIPFKVVSTSTKHCPFGPTYWGQCAGLPNDQKKSQLVFISKSSYKTGCSAVYQVKCVRYFPDFRVDDGPEPLKWHKRHKRQQSLTLLKKELARKGSSLHSFDRYYVEIADTTRHNHCFASSLTHNLHPMIAMQITNLVAEGITDFKEMKERLGEYVSVLNEDEHETNSLTNNIVYFPSNYFIKKHFNKALEQQEHSKRILSALSEKAGIGSGINENEMIPGASINVSHEEVVPISDLSAVQDGKNAVQVLHLIPDTSEQDDKADNQIDASNDEPQDDDEEEEESDESQRADGSQILHRLSCGVEVTSELETSPETDLLVSSRRERAPSEAEEIEECEIAAQILRTLHENAEDALNVQPHPGLAVFLPSSPTNRGQDDKNTSRELHFSQEQSDGRGDEEEIHSTVLAEPLVKDQENEEGETPRQQRVEEQILNPLPEKMEADSAIPTDSKSPGIPSGEVDNEIHLLRQRQQQASNDFQTLVGQLKATAQLCEDTEKLEKVNDMLGLCSKLLQSGIPSSERTQEPSHLPNFDSTENLNTVTNSQATNGLKRQGTDLTSDTEAKRVR